MLDLSLGAPGYDFSQEVVLKSRVNCRAVLSYVAQMTWGAIVRSLVMVDVLDAELGRIIEFRVPSVKVNACYANAPATYNERCREKHASVSSTRNCWSTLKESVLEVGSSIPPLQSDGGTLVSDPAGKACLLSNLFDRKQFRDVYACGLCS